MASPSEQTASHDADLQLPVDEAEALNRFLALTKWEVEAEALRTLSRAPNGTTWMGLSTLMQRRGYPTVDALGTPAAVSWARHLGIIGDAEVAS